MWFFTNFCANIIIAAVIRSRWKWQCYNAVSIHTQDCIDPFYKNLSAIQKSSLENITKIK